MKYYNLAIYIYIYTPRNGFNLGFVFVVLFGLHGCCICFVMIYGDIMDEAMMLLCFLVVIYIYILYIYIYSTYL